MWSVSIVEKAILRWRRKGAGLRGFRGEQPGGIDEYDFLSDGRRQKSEDVKKALDRVKSMVRNPEARDQYMRLILKYQKFKVVTIYFLLQDIFLCQCGAGGFRAFSVL